MYLFIRKCFKFFIIIFEVNDNDTGMQSDVRGDTFYYEEDTEIGDYHRISWLVCWLSGRNYFIIVLATFIRARPFGVISLDPQ